MTAPLHPGFRYTDTFEFMDRVRDGMPPVIICLASNGAIQGKEYNEHLPESNDELADSIYEAYRAGASMVHMHARHPDNIADPATTAEVWYDLHQKVRARCPDIVLNDTTGGGFNMTMAERLACLDARPEMASLNLTPDMSRFTLKARNPPLKHPHPEQEIDDCIPFTYRLVTQFAGEMRQRGIKPEIELTHSGSQQVVRHLMQQGLLDPPYWVQTVMGYQTASYPTVEGVLHLLKDFPPDSIWLCSGIGPFQLPMTTLAMLMGGHARVGLEDNVYYRRGERATNAQLVARTARIAHELNRDVATPAQTRAMLGLSATPSQYP
jgi:3-keto-5-aminohexanoate cleavage enzyme